jgi:Ethanolamine utilization protein EutJ (predicted chaperonin)
MKMDEKEKEFLNKIADEITKKAEEIRKYIEVNDITGIWLVSISIGSILNQLDNFINEKRELEKRG